MSDYEQKAEQFYRETGVMAPGKDISPAMGMPDAMELRTKLWENWLKLSLATRKLEIAVDELKKLWFDYALPEPMREEIQNALARIEAVGT